MSAPLPGLIPVLSLRISVGDARELGRTRAGLRRITRVLGGEIRGELGGPFEALRGEILPGGGDRQLLREDGAGNPVVEIDAAYQARTAERRLIDIRAVGVRRQRADGVYFRVAMSFEASAPELAELQNALYVADGVREDDVVRHVVYRVD